MSFVDRLMLASLLAGVVIGAGLSALFALLPIFKRIKAMSQQSDAILAGITKNTDALKSVQLAVSGLTEGHSTIEEEIAALKAQIAAGAAPDLSALEAAVADQGAVIAGLETAIPARTPFDPSANR